MEIQLKQSMSKPAEPQPNIDGEQNLENSIIQKAQIKRTYMTTPKFSTSSLLLKPKFEIFFSSNADSSSQDQSETSHNWRSNLL